MNPNRQKANRNQRTLLQAWSKNEPSNCRNKLSANDGKSSNPRKVGLFCVAEAAEKASAIVDLTDDDLIEAAELMESSVSNVGPSNASTAKVEHLPGFDRSLGDIWIYPTNYPLRQYQFNIVQNALTKNTLVSLPTGLGKTFIAAIVMYNFYRWYPEGKIIFMAPTKPLVTQQMEACYSIVGIPREDQVEITGRTLAHKREALWSSKRVFFLTPQVINNDLARGVCPCDQIKCVVMDEAHRALGNYAYCQVINQLVSCTRQFRVLALSATPGIDVKSVQHVITNLLIAHIEIRSEDSIDIQGFSHRRKVEKIVCKLGETMLKMKNNYLRVIESFTKNLVNRRVLFQMETSSYSRYTLLMAREQYRKDPPRGLSKYEMGAIEGDFATCISLLHGLELLLQHGMRSFYISLKSMMESEKGSARSKSILGANQTFNDIYQDLTDMFGESPNPKVLLTQAGQTQKCFQRPEASAQHLSCIYSHPKMEKLEEVVVSHFELFVQSDEHLSTRVMVFSQYRDSVGEITELLQKHRPLVRPMQFIGQSTASGKASTKFTQKDQLEVVSRFRSGGYNTLISTCVGEEGLDIGDVDLIVCFDSHKSPIRLVQRMGRTGRKRAGRIVMLLTEGKEERDYNTSVSNRKSIERAIVNNSGRGLQFYQHNPRMIPRGLNPKPLKMHITVKQQAVTSAPIMDSKKKQKKPANADISVLMKKAAKQESSIFLNSNQMREWDQKLKLSAREKERLKTLPIIPQMLCLKKMTMASPRKRPTLSLTEWSLWQTRLQESKVSGHSSTTKNLVEAMEICDLVKQCDEEDFKNNLASFFGVKYDNFKNELERIPVKVLTKEKRLIKMVKKVLSKSSEEAENFQLTSDPDFVSVKPKKLFPEKLIFQKKNSAFAASDDTGVSAGGDDTLAGIDSILADREMTAYSIKDSSVAQHNDEAVTECLPDFDIGDWDMVDSPRREKGSNILDVKSNNMEAGSSVPVVEESLLDFIENLSVIATQTPLHHSATEPSEKLISKEMPLSNLSMPSSLEAISFEFMNGFGSDVSDLDEDCEKPTKKRVCFSLGNDKNEKIKSFHQRKQSSEIKTSDVFLGERKSFCRTDKGMNRLDNFGSKKGEENMAQSSRVSQTELKDVKKACSVLVDGFTETSASFTTPAVSEQELIMCAEKPKMYKQEPSLVDVSADMFASQFLVDFDLGDSDDDEGQGIVSTVVSPILASKSKTKTDSAAIGDSCNKKFVFGDSEDYESRGIGSTVLSPILASKSKTNTDSAAIEGCSNAKEKPLAPLTLSQRVENQALFSELLRKQNVPVAEIKPQRSAAFLNDDLDNRVNVRSTKRKLLQGSSDTTPSKRKKDLANQTLKMNLSGHNTQDVNLEESPLLGRDKRHSRKGVLISPLCGDSQQTPEEEVEHLPGAIGSRDITPKALSRRPLHHVPSLSPLVHGKVVKKLDGKKHSTPKCDIKYPKHIDFSEDEDFAPRTRNKKRPLAKRKGADSSDHVRNYFFDNEAEVSNDGVSISSDEDGTNDLEAWKEMKNFVNDASMLTQHVGNGREIDERAMYLQQKPDFYSEPAQFGAHCGKFKLAYDVGKDLEVFSQARSTDASDYEEDSFVCDEVEHEASEATAPGEVTMPENVVESEGKQRVTRKQAELNKHRSSNGAASNVKKSTKFCGKVQPFRKRIVCFDDSADSIDSADMSLKLSQSKRKNESDSNTWTCPSCTLLNSFNCQACELCDTEKPNSVALTGKAGFEPWSCLSCTFINRNALNVCDMCGDSAREKPKTVGDSETFAKSAKRHSDLKAKMPMTSAVEQNGGSKDAVPIRANRDVIPATPIIPRTDRDVRKKLNITASKLDTSGSKESSSRISTTQNCSQISASSSTSTKNEGREERLMRCKQKQMEFRARMLKRRSQQSETSSEKLDPSIVMESPGSATTKIATLQVKSPITTSSDVINTSLTNTAGQSRKKEESNVVLIDSKQLSSSQAIITTLRSRHAVHAIVASLPHCDYIVGRGTAVERKMVSDLSQVSNRQKVAVTLQQLNIHYERIYLIIEQDRVKKGDMMSSGRSMHSSHYISTLCALSNTNVRILYSDNQDDTANLLHVLASRERGLKRAIDMAAANKANDAKYKTLLRLYSCIPKVSFVSALYMCLNFRNLTDAARCSVEKLIQKAHLSTSAAAEVYNFFKRDFDLQMTPSR